MSFWETAAGHNLAQLMSYFFQMKMQSRQYTKVLSNEEAGKYIIEEIKKGNRFIGAVPYDNGDELLVIMED